MPIVHMAKEKRDRGPDGGSAHARLGAMNTNELNDQEIERGLLRDREAREEADRTVAAWNAVDEDESVRNGSQISS